RAGRFASLGRGPHDPARPVRVKAVVVIKMQLPNGSRLVAWIELDNTDPAEVPANLLYVAREFRRYLPVLRPDAVTIRPSMVPETAAVHLTGRRSQRSEVRVAPALPVHVFE